MLKPESSENLARALFSSCLPLIKFLQFRSSGFKILSSLLFLSANQALSNSYFPQNPSKAGTLLAVIIPTLRALQSFVHWWTGTWLLLSSRLGCCLVTLWSTFVETLFDSGASHFGLQTASVLSPKLGFNTSLLYSLPAWFFQIHPCILDAETSPTFLCAETRLRKMTFDARFYRIKFGPHLRSHFQNVSLIPVTVVIGTITWLQNLFHHPDFLNISSWSA